VQSGRSSNFDGLEILDMASNKLECVPNSIDKFIALRVLYLCHNQIDTVSRNIDTLPNLEFLSLRNNPMGRVPYYVTRISNLKFLWFDGLPGCDYGAMNIEIRDINKVMKQ
jgi:Leucine-rich repeat (LRR) protein